MGIVRLFTVVAVLWLVWFFYRRFQQHLVERKQTQKKNVSVSSVKKCAFCGVYIPENEALKHDGRYYCSEAHKGAH